MTRTLVTYSLRTIPFIFLVSNYIVTVDAVEGRAADSGSKAQKYVDWGKLLIQLMSC